MIYKVCTTCVHIDKPLSQFPCYKCETFKNYECSEWEPKEGFVEPKENENERKTDS